MNINFLYAILTGILPPLIWLVFWLREDANPEPRSLISSLFFAGAVSVIVALLCEGFIVLHGQDPNIPYTNLQWILLAGVEEIVKFIILITVALNAKSNDEPIDAMMYCITIALGFAALENILFVMGPFAHGNAVEGLINGNMRAIGATLVHTVSTVCPGFIYGYLFYSKKITKFFGLIIGLAAAITIHSLFNISVTGSVIGGDTTNTLRVFAWIWGAVVIMIVLFEEIKMVRPKEI